jgi:hypothetical protein
MGGEYTVRRHSRSGYLRFVVEPGWPKPGPLNWLTNRLVTDDGRHV